MTVHLSQMPEEFDYEEPFTCSRCKHMGSGNLPSRGLPGTVGPLVNICTVVNGKSFLCNPFGICNRFEKKEN